MIINLLFPAFSESLPIVIFEWLTQTDVTLLHKGSIWLGAMSLGIGLFIAALNQPRLREYRGASRAVKDDIRNSIQISSMLVILSALLLVLGIFGAITAALVFGIWIAVVGIQALIESRKLFAEEQKGS